MNRVKREDLIRELSKEYLMSETLAQWVLVEHERKNISDLINEMGYKTIGIYGYGYLGKLLNKVVDPDKVNVVCIIDRQFNDGNGFYLSLKQELPYTDVIIVTSPYYYEEIRKDIKAKYPEKEVRSIDEFLFQL